MTIILSGCTTTEGLIFTEQSPAISSAPEISISSNVKEPESAGSAPDPAENLSLGTTNNEISVHPYIAELVSNIVDKISNPKMSEYERTKAAFDYMIWNTYLDELVGLDLWRIHGGGQQSSPFLEQRALSPLRFGVRIMPPPSPFCCVVWGFRRNMYQAPYLLGGGVSGESRLDNGTNRRGVVSLGQPARRQHLLPGLGALPVLPQK